MLKLARLMIFLLGLGALLPLQVNADKVEDFLEYSGHRFADPFADKMKKADQLVMPIQAPVPAEGLSEDEVNRRYKIQGVVWNTGRHQAIVNRQIVEVGDIVNEARIDSISKNGVELTLAGKKYLLKRDEK